MNADQLPPASPVGGAMVSVPSAADCGVEIVMRGGMANAGAVTRAGDHVLRPSNPHTITIHRFLNEMWRIGFTGVPRPAGIEPDGRERLRFIEGHVALAPYPAWAQADDALGSVARLLRRFHDAAATIAPLRGDTWSAEMSDPAGGPVVCHNDVCLENVVFRGGEAVGLVDFDFAAPGRPVFDVASFARMCVPVDDEQSRAELGWHPADVVARVRLVADEYGLGATGRRELLAALDSSIASGGTFVRRRVEAGDPNFIEMWTSMGGMARYDRRRSWWAERRAAFEAGLR